MKTIVLLTAFLAFGLTPYAQLKEFSINELLKVSDELFTQQGEAADTGLFVLGNSLFEQEKYDSAAIAFSACIVKNPRYIDAYFKRGYSYLEKKKYHQALSDFDEVIGLDASWEGAYRNKAYIYASMNNYKEALKNYQIALNLSRDVILNFYIAITKEQLGVNVKDIIPNYDLLLSCRDFKEFEPGMRATIFNNKAYALIKLNKLSEALPLVNQALSIEERFAFIWDTRGELYFKMGKYLESISDMDKAIGLDGNADNSYYYRGLAKLKLKRDGCTDLKIAQSLGNAESTLVIKQYCK